jgi:hypothetical protein
MRLPRFFSASDLDRTAVNGADARCRRPSVSPQGRPLLLPLRGQVRGVPPCRRSPVRAGADEVLPTRVGRYRAHSCARGVRIRRAALRHVRRALSAALGDRRGDRNVSGARTTSRSGARSRKTGAADTRIHSAMSLSYRKRRFAGRSDAGGGTRTPDTRIMIPECFGSTRALAGAGGHERRQNRGLGGRRPPWPAAAWHSLTG